MGFEPTRACALPVFKTGAINRSTTPPMLESARELCHPSARGQALRADGSVIVGLYCAGLTAANPIGTKAVGAGTTLGPCLTSGYICGLDLAGAGEC